MTVLSFIFSFFVFLGWVDPFEIILTWTKVSKMRNACKFALFKSTRMTGRYWTIFDYKFYIILQADLFIFDLFICKFAYMRLKMILFYRTYPLFYGHPWSFYMRIRYMWDIFYGSYLSNIMRSACINDKNDQINVNKL
jgi:hypothetical protein